MRPSPCSQRPLPFRARLFSASAAALAVVGALSFCASAPDVGAAGGSWLPAGLARLFERRPAPGTDACFRERVLEVLEEIADGESPPRGTAVRLRVDGRDSRTLHLIGRRTGEDAGLGSVETLLLVDPTTRELHLLPATSTRVVARSEAAAPLRDLDARELPEVLAIRRQESTTCATWASYNCFRYSQGVLGVPPITSDLWSKIRAFASPAASSAETIGLDAQRRGELRMLRRLGVPFRRISAEDARFEDELVAHLGSGGVARLGYRVGAFEPAERVEVRHLDGGLEPTRSTTSESFAAPASGHVGDGVGGHAVTAIAAIPPRAGWRGRGTGASLVVADSATGRLVWWDARTTRRLSHSSLNEAFLIGAEPAPARPPRSVLLRSSGWIAYADDGLVGRDAVLDWVPAGAGAGRAERIRGVLLGADARAVRVLAAGGEVRELARADGALAAATVADDLRWTPATSHFEATDHFLPPDQGQYALVDRGDAGVVVGRVRSVALGRGYSVLEILQEAADGSVERHYVDPALPGAPGVRLADLDGASARELRPARATSGGAVVDEARALAAAKVPRATLRSGGFVPERVDPRHLPLPLLGDLLAGLESQGLRVQLRYRPAAGASRALRAATSEASSGEWRLAICSGSPCLSASGDGAGPVRAVLLEDVVAIEIAPESRALARELREGRSVVDLIREVAPTPDLVRGLAPTLEHPRDAEPTPPRR